MQRTLFARAVVLAAFVASSLLIGQRGALADDPSPDSLEAACRPYHLTKDEIAFIFDQTMLIGWAGPCEVVRRDRIEIASSLAKWIGDTGGNRVLKDPDLGLDKLPSPRDQNALLTELEKLRSFAAAMSVGEIPITCREVSDGMADTRDFFARSGSLLDYKTLQGLKYE